MNYYFGFVPLGLFFITTIVLIQKKILTWEDPLGNLLPGDEKKEDAKETELVAAPSTSM